MKTIDELDKYLCEKYPKLFRDRHGDMQKTCMVWGLDIGAGWGNIMESLCSNIQWHIDQSRQNRNRVLRYNRALKKGMAGDPTPMYRYFQGDMSAPTAWSKKCADEAIAKGTLTKAPEACPQVVVSQVKEKFGGLRFYYYGGDEYVSGLVAMAESMSNRTCEVCGSPGKQTGAGWSSTKCGTHSQTPENLGDNNVSEGINQMKITSADGVSGCLIYSENDKYLFRVYDDHHNFVDYDILHSDLGLKIEDPDAFFYEHEDGRTLLDHSPNTLGL